MTKIINLYTQKENTPIPYKPEIDQSDYALWKARQNSSNIVVLPIYTGGDDSE